MSENSMWYLITSIMYLTAALAIMSTSDNYYKRPFVYLGFAGAAFYGILAFIY